MQFLIDIVMNRKPFAHLALVETTFFAHKHSCDKFMKF